MPDPAKASVYPAIEPGKLRHFMAIESPTTSRDAYGQPVPGTWNLVRSGWFSIEEVRGREAYQGGQFTSLVSHLITGRWTAVNVTAAMRVVKSNGQVYKIQSVDNVDQRNVVIRLMCLAINEGTNP